MKQQLLLTRVVLWQLRGPSIGQEGAKVKGGEKERSLLLAGGVLNVNWEMRALLPM